jgi:hypothetical protein
MTIARFALDGAALPLGAVVVLDEISQVATADADVVLAAAAATPGARLWCLGDPHQAQAVRAGGLGAELARLGQEGRVPAPQLTQNRRQLDAGERQALAQYRAGHLAVSQAIRSRHGWEHDLGSPHATREALADAVAADIATHGPSTVAALAVAHADCEDLTDRIRQRLLAAGHIHGAELAGPAWTSGARSYGAGDRILVHGPLRTGGQHLHNGTVLTVTAVAEDGLQAVDASGRAVTLPRPFVKGHRSDGSPNCSHAWARTVDGIQGATWTQVHLLGTAALERFTGYTGQSRSRYATHTWNVTRLSDIDHGGVLADQRTADREVLDALRRVPETGFAVHDTPSRLAHLLAERAEHQAVLATRPPDRFRHLRDAERKLASAIKDREDAHWRLDHARHELANLGALSQLHRRGRHDKATLLERINRFEDDVRHAEGKVTRCEKTLRSSREDFAAEIVWQVQHGWRTERLGVIDAEVAQLRGDDHASENRLPDHSRRQGLLDRQRSTQLPTPDWDRRLAEIATPPLPSRDSGHGLDIGL